MEIILLEEFLLAIFLMWFYVYCFVFSQLILDFQRNWQLLVLHYHTISEIVKLVEDIVVDYVTNMAHKAQDIATKRGKLLTEDFLFLIRKDSVKLNLCRELLTMHEDLKEAQKAFEFDQEELAHMSEGEV
uniref:Transcription initiation factor TFIID subunit 13 n=1 Tax=Solanum lycopersicum TaxID=4081 RepID=A0A3Q7GQJ8_SOLLC